MEAKINDCEHRVGGLVVNSVRPDDDREVRVYTSISKNLKPHQEAGVRFMWMQAVESLTQLNKSIVGGADAEGVVDGGDDAAMEGVEGSEGSDGAAAEENKCGVNGASNGAGAATARSASGAACGTAAAGAAAVGAGGRATLGAAAGAAVGSEAELDRGEGMGCILAHSMGLGKTLQVVTFVHTLTTHPAVRAHFRKVVILAPKVQRHSATRVLGGISGAFAFIFCPLRPHTPTRARTHAHTRTHTHTRTRTHSPQP